MGKLTEEITFTGSVGNVSAYRMKGSDKIIFRKKGGGFSKTIKTSASCANIRKINAEFGGRSAATRLIRRAIGMIKALAHFTFTGHLNALVRPVHVEDAIRDFRSTTTTRFQYQKIKSCRHISDVRFITCRRSHP